MSDKSSDEGCRSAAADLVDHRLYRTHYLVIPRLAIQAMPDGWKARFEALLAELRRRGDPVSLRAAERSLR